MTRSTSKWLRDGDFTNQLIKIERVTHLDKVLLEKPGKIVERRHTHINTDSGNGNIADDGDYDDYGDDGNDGIRNVEPRPKSILKKVKVIPIGARGRKRAKSVPALLPIHNHAARPIEAPALLPIQNNVRPIGNRNSTAKDIISGRLNENQSDEPGISINDIDFGSIENLF